MTGAKTGTVEENPSLAELLELAQEDVATAWDRFQFGITKREMFPTAGGAVAEVVDSMRQLPIVGKPSVQ